MSRRNKLTLLVALCIFSLTLFTGCRGSGPTKEQLKKDIAEYLEENWGFDYVKITTIDIKYAGSDDGEYEAKISIKGDVRGPFTMGDDGKVGGLCKDYLKDTIIEVTYKYYRTGGWVLKELEEKRE